jgi:hypothetical protein
MNAHTEETGHTDEAGHTGETAPFCAPVDPKRLRQHLAVLARTIARTEDRLADTLERLMLTRPQDAPRLREQATRARRYATIERSRTAVYSRPPQPAPPGGTPL